MNSNNVRTKLNAERDDRGGSDITLMCFFPVSSPKIAFGLDRRAPACQGVKAVQLSGQDKIMLERLAEADTRVNDELIGCKSRTLSTLHTLFEALRDVGTDVVVGYLALLHRFGVPRMCMMMVGH